MVGNIPEICGAKVVLQKFSEENITDEYIAWLNNPTIVQYSNQRFKIHTHLSCKNYLQSFKDNRNHFFVIKSTDSLKAIGTMTAYISPEHGVADIGIMIGDESVWGKGYGQNAWDTLLHWFMEQKVLRKITAGTMGCNKGMIKIMERSGMELEAVRKDQELINSRAVDILYYAKFYAV